MVRLISSKNPWVRFFSTSGIKIFVQSYTYASKIFTGRPLPVPDRHEVESKLKFLLKSLKAISPPEWVDFKKYYTAIRDLYQVILIGYLIFFRFVAYIFVQELCKGLKVVFVLDLMPAGKRNNRVHPIR